MKNTSIYLSVCLSIHLSHARVSLPVLYLMRSCSSEATALCLMVPLILGTKTTHSAEQLHGRHNALLPLSGSIPLSGPGGSGLQNTGVVLSAARRHWTGGDFDLHAALLALTAKTPDFLPPALKGWRFNTHTHTFRSVSINVAVNHLESKIFLPCRAICHHFGGLVSPLPTPRQLKAADDIVKVTTHSCPFMCTTDGAGNNYCFLAVFPCPFFSLSFCFFLLLG